MGKMGNAKELSVKTERENSKWVYTVSIGRCEEQFFPFQKN